jgi:hypothetical protein
MSARRTLAALVAAGAGLAAAFSGCKDKESLVIVTLTTAAGDPTLATATVSVGTESQTFELKNGVPAAGVSLGVYVSSSLKGSQPISVVAAPAQPGDCNGETGSGTVNITTVGDAFGPVLIPLAPSTAACAGTGGAKGTGGTTGGAGMAGGGGRGGAGTGGVAGFAGTGGAGGHAGGTGTGGGGPGTGGGGPGTGGVAGSTGTGGLGGGGQAPTGITACYEYDHGNPGDCAMSSCTNDHAVYGAAFSPVNPRLAVTSGTDGRTKVWTVSNGAMAAEGHVLTTAAPAYGVVAFSPDGSLLAIGINGGVQIVNVATWTVARTLTVANKVYGVGFSPDGTQVITLDDLNGANNLYVHAVTNVTALHVTAVSSGYALAVSPVASASGLPVVVTTTTGNALFFTLTASGFSSPTTLNVTSDSTLVTDAAQFTRAGNLLAVGADDGIVHFWPVPLTGSAQPPTIDVNTVTGGTSDYVYALAYSPDGAELAVGGGYYGSVTTFVAASRTKVGVEQDTSAQYDVTVLGYSPDGKSIIGGEANCGCVFLCQH